MSPEKTSEISFWRSFFGVFTAPRTTIREILDKDSKAYFWPLLLVMASSDLTDPNLETFLVDKMPTQAAIALSMVVDGLFTFGCFWFMAWIIYVSGKAMGGNGTLAQIQTATIWSSPPFIVGSFFGLWGNWPIWSGLLAGQTDRNVLTTLPHNIGQDIALVVQFGLLIWSVVLQVAMVSEAHHISKWKAFWAGTAQLLTLLGVVLVLCTLFAVVWYFGRS